MVNHPPLALFLDPLDLYAPCLHFWWRLMVIGRLRWEMRRWTTFSFSFWERAWLLDISHGIWEIARQWERGGMMDWYEMSVVRKKDGEVWVCLKSWKKGMGRERESWLGKKEGWVACTYGMACTWLDLMWHVVEILSKFTTRGVSLKWTRAHISYPGYQFGALVGVLEPRQWRSR
jgi:hypothetical protein